MKDLLNKIINSTLAIMLAVITVATTHYFMSSERHLFSANILDAANASDIEAVRGVSFVSPSGSVFPTNGVVTVQSLHVDFTAGSGITDGNISGSDIESSFITLTQGSVPCPAATSYIGNQVILPSTFAGSCTVGISVPGHVNINEDDGLTPALDNTNELTIEALTCSDLQTSILRGYGSGFQTIDPVDLANLAFATSAPFDFNAATAVSSIELNYPSTQVNGAKTFQIRLDLVPDIAVDPLNGIAARAEISANAGDGIYEILVRDEGTNEKVKTASNFMYVFNDLLGTDSPFIAYTVSGVPTSIELQATEIGAHPNAGYICSLNDALMVPCFSGGVDGLNTAAGLLTVPLTLDNEITQGDTAIVFAAGSAGEIQWISSHPSLLEVVSLSEANEQGESLVNFVTELLSTVGEDPDESNSAYVINNCEEEFDDSAVPVIKAQTCSVTVTVPIEYDISAESYEAEVTADGEIVTVPLTGSSLVGSITATANYVMGIGVSFAFTGSVSGPISGSVAGQYSGTVNGIITADVIAAETIVDQGVLDNLTKISGNMVLVPADLSAGTLKEVPGSFTTTVKKIEDDISHISLLYAKRPGTAILTAIDKLGCIASFEVEIPAQQVVLDMVGHNPGDVLEVSDTIQINAFVGSANGEIDEYSNITASTGIEWFSSNEDVVTVDSTGLLTALKPGVANITAHYDTGEAEIGTIESLPMQVTVNKISGMRIAFDEATEAILPADVVEAAHESVMIAVHDPSAVGQVFVVEGQQVTVTLPAAEYESDIAKIEAIVDALETSIATLQNASAQFIVTVSPVQGFPGMLILQPVNQTAPASGVVNIDENGIIDITTTALDEDASILPTYSNAVPLPSSETYGLRVVVEYDNGATKLLNPTEFTWVNTPVNYLEQASLDSGLIRLGQIAGTSTVVAQYQNADASIVTSNYLTIKVNSGPAIEFVRRIGSGSVTKGSRINLQAKVTDVDTISDIASISTSLVNSNFTTYTQINEDADAIWFTATPFLSEVDVVSQSSGDDPEGEETTAPVSLQFKTYNIPVEIPVDQNLIEGLVYKFILSISDVSNHTINYVYPIYIGDFGEGDVSGDGVVNMIDVILVFQIASGILPNPTPAQLEAANVDGMGGVTMVDVILLFNQVTS